MKIQSVAVVGLAVTLQVASAANIVGTITFKGTPPAEVPLPQVKEDATCGPLHATIPTTHHYVVGPKGELANVVVVLKGKDLNGKSKGAEAPPVLLEQKGCLFTPSILAIQTNQKLLVRNSDPVPMHNVRAQPTAPGNPEINLPQMQGAPDLTFSFPKPENFIKIECNVHPWMLAWVTVVDHPYFSLSGTDGTFKIANVPPGNYTVVALHRKAAPTGVEKEIEVKDGDVTVDFTLELK